VFFFQKNSLTQKKGAILASVKPLGSLRAARVASDRETQEEEV
jgi:hypothetical protein